MAVRPLRFLTGARRWTILELNEEEALASLTEVWRLPFGCEPDFGETGDATTGFH